MVENALNEQKLPDLKEASGFRRSLKAVEESLGFWYGLKSEEIPVLGPSSIQFLPDSQFKEKSLEFLPKDTLLVQALSVLGVKKDDIFSFKKSPNRVFAEGLQSRVLYAKRESFAHFYHPDSVVRDAASLQLSFDLADINLFLLSRMRPLSGEEKDYWRPRLVNEIGLLFDEFKPKIPPEKQDEIGKAKELFKYFIEEDPTFKFFARGSEIYTTIEQDGKDNLLCILASEFNEQVTLSLAERVKTRIVDQYVLANRALSREKLSDILKRRRNEKKVVESEDFLRRLKLGSYSDLFAAFRQSLIPQIYLERLQVRPNLPPYPVG